MKDGSLVGLLNPMIALIFSITFLVFWSRDKQRIYILVIAISYLTMGVGFLISLFVLDDWVLMRSAVSNFCYAAATVMLIWALAKRAAFEAPTTLLCLIAALSVPLNTWLKISSDNINASLYLTNFAIGAMFGIGAWVLRENAKKSVLEKLVFWAILLTAIQFWVRPIISLAIETNIQPLEYRQSTYWVVLNFTTALFSVVVALTLIAACARDVMVDLIEDSSVDHLSGLKIRSAFDAEARLLVAERADTSMPLCMILLDIDYFKQVNDRYGHPCGDEVIRLFGDLLVKSISEHDVCGRVGGEEFCIVLSHVDHNAARKLAENIREKVHALQLKCIPANEKLSASFGVVCLEPNERFDAFYARADAALYQAKNDGRNCVRVGSNKP